MQKNEVGVEGPNKGTKKGEKQIPATQAVMLNDRQMLARGLPRGARWRRASNHGRDEPACLRVLLVGWVRLWVQAVRRQRELRGGGVVVGAW